MCLLVLAGLLVGSVSAAQERRAALRVVALQPLQLAGSGFLARESVRVTVSSEGDVTRRTVRATARGSFSVQFDTVTADRCSAGITAVARGARGSFATAKVLPQPLCPPALREPE
jgi:hypothetical protein